MTANIVITVFVLLLLLQIVGLFFFGEAIRKLYELTKEINTNIKYQNTLQNVKNKVKDYGNKNS